MLKKVLQVLFVAMISLMWVPAGLCGQTLVAHKVAQAPDIDGKDSDIIWQPVVPLVTHDPIARIDIKLKAVYTDQEVFFLVQFADPDRSVIHKPWVWDKENDFYRVGNEHEEIFVFKWALQPPEADLRLGSEAPYTADTWYWKAQRTNPIGYADDKIQIYGKLPVKRAAQITTKSGRVMYLVRKGDQGTAAYQTIIYPDYKGDRLKRFEHPAPTGSRADIRAKGVWKDGLWTIEFRRALQTGHADDVQFRQGGSYRFGVSRYEIAGRKPNPKLSQPLYGSGDITETLTLVFE